MAQTVEFDLAKVLEDFRQDIKETNRKLDKVIEGQAKQEVDIQNIKEDIKDLKEDVKDLKSIYKWVIGLLVALMGLIITLTVGIGTILLKTSDLFPTP